MLELHQISKVYNSKFKTNVKALNNINLSFLETGCNVILGPSGCGKSTLLNIIGGLDEATNGSLIYNSYELKKSDLDLWRNDIIGFIFQDFNLISDLTVYENLSIVCYDKTEDEKNELIKKVLTRVNLEDYENRYPYEISGGEIQRVAIARALLKDCKILLADEPTGNLNKEMSKEIFVLLKELSKEKLVIIVTHNEELADDYADRIIKIEDGHIVFDSNPIKDLMVEKEYKPRLKNRLSNKLVFKMSMKNIFSKKLRYITSMLAFVLLFTILSLSFSIIDFNGYYVDTNNIIENNIERFYLKDCDTDDDRLNFTSANEIVENNDMIYILNNEVESANDILAMGYCFYEGYNEISYEGIYVLDKYLIYFLHRGEIFSDSLGQNEVAKDIEIKNLVDKYLLFNGEYLKIDGIIKSNYLDFVNGSEQTMVDNDEFYFTTYSNIFSKKDSLHKKIKIDRHIVFNSLHSAFNMTVNSKTMNNKDLHYTFISDYLDVFNNENIYKNESDLEIADNEVYISLDLYNYIFSEFSPIEYYLGENYFFNPVIQKQLTHIGENISFRFTYDNGKQIEIPNLIIKGIIYNENGYSIYSTLDVCDKIYDSTVDYQIMVKTSSIDNLNKFISYNCDKYNISVYYPYTEAVNNFEEGLLLAKLISTIIFIIVMVIVILISITSINQTIRSKDKENGILRSIGISLKDMNKIYFYQLLFMIFIPFIISIILSIVGVGIVDYLLVYEYSTKVQLLFFKIWYVPCVFIIICLLNIIIGAISLRSILNKNTIEIVRQN